MSDLRGKLKNAINRLIREDFENDKKLAEYLFKAVDNISIRLKSAADNGYPGSVF